MKKSIHTYLILLATLGSTVLHCSHGRKHRNENAIGNLYHPIEDNDTTTLLRLIRQENESVESSSWIYRGGGPLHKAVTHHHYASAQILMQHGASPNRTNHQNKTPLDLTLADVGYDQNFSLRNFSQINSDIAIMLLKRGAALTSAFKQQRSRQSHPQHYAAFDQRGQAIGAWIGHIERDHGVPRDISRLIGAYADLPHEQMPSAPGASVPASGRPKEPEGLFGWFKYYIGF